MSFKLFLGVVIRVGAYLCRVANLEEAGSSVEDCAIIVSRPSQNSSEAEQYRLEVLPCLQIAGAHDVLGSEEMAGHDEVDVGGGGLVAGCDVGRIRSP